ncbi:MAG TPA: mismatch-specific DNA-glycosylase [Ilumatobacteraceae bacterium]|nr:mismatch-specific DNA-glycosylase [Ilumatobacteraceae bacterium]
MATPPKPIRRSDLADYEGAEVDDLIGPGLRLLFVGINPGLWTAAANAHFARRGNRFWPALHAAGILPETLDVSAGMTAAQRALVIGRGVGITNIVPVATAAAAELTRQQLVDGAARLTSLVRRRKPRVVAILGVTAYRQAFAERSAAMGRQPADLAGAALWVLPNPSGLNAHETVATLAEAYAEPARHAGVLH